MHGMLLVRCFDRDDVLTFDAKRARSTYEMSLVFEWFLEYWRNEFSLHKKRANAGCGSSLNGQYRDCAILKMPSELLNLHTQLENALLNGKYIKPKRA